VTDYAGFLERRAQLADGDGFDPVWMPDFLFPFQVDLTTWALRRGRAAIFADCGLGKTPMQLVWAENVVRQTGGRVLIVTPLAVNHQTIKEGAKFGIEVRRSDDGTAHSGITVTNYERLHHFDATDFVGTVCDESSAIKSFNGVRRELVTRFMAKQQYRLLCTATAAPNDYYELGTSSEALGELNRTDVLNRFFKNDDGTSLHCRQKWVGQSDGRKQIGWRFKGHAEEPFWRWVSTWARALRRPSDVGYDDGGFLIPPLNTREHLVHARKIRPGMLFEVESIGRAEEIEEQRRTIPERCEMAAELVNGTGESAVVWCHYNDEGKMLACLIPDAVEVAGCDSDEHKELAFMAFAAGDVRVLVTKPKIGAWGLNWQHCAHMTFFPSHSYEQYYQAVRRCWRYGQTKPVNVDIITTEGGHDIMANLDRKARQADTMFTALVAHMNEALSINTYRATAVEELPTWLSTIN
jgi:hypothetical protein